MKKSLTGGSRVKTGISIDRNLAEQTDSLAREMGVSRSGLYAMALREFVRRRETGRLLEKLDEVYGELAPEDAPLIEGAKRYSRRVLDEDER